MAKPHTTEDLILHCIDFRFAHNHYIQGHYDELSYAGGCLCVLDDTGTFLDAVLTEDGSSYVTFHLKLAIRLHGVRRIHLIDHEDCGVYKKLFPHATEEGERFELHMTYLKMARERIKVFLQLLAQDADIAKEGLRDHVEHIEVRIAYAKLDMSVEDMDSHKVMQPTEQVACYAVEDKSAGPPEPASRTVQLYVDLTGRDVSGVSGLKLRGRVARHPAPTP